ncbi:MAG TPA: phosphotransferase [Streptosporangiaceae bacterium]|nr:phosphotransferase [Streptosporangiaceae bacterium]
MASHQLAELLMDWLPRQRWFAGKGREVSSVEFVSDTRVVAGDPGLRHAIVTVRQGPADATYYQLLLGFRHNDLPGRLEYASIGVVEDMYVYDAAHDPDLTRTLLARMAEGADVGPLRFRTVPGARLDTGLTSLASPAEQSNTSLVYGDAYICKLFRRLTPGVNPDLEISLALSGPGSKHIPELYGWIETVLDGESTTLAMLSEYLRTATDGWQLATTSVRDLYAEADLHAYEVGGDFAAESERLGVATATVHRDLAEAFGTTSISADEVRALAGLMRARLDEASATVPELAPYTGPIGAAFDDLAARDEPLPVQRIHGDYHLGQVMRTEVGWMLLDFEGEPARPLAERRAPGHPLRDVAGMLRSFEYAARYLLTGPLAMAADDPAHDQREYRAREWADRNRDAFCTGYTDAGGPDPTAHEVLLRAFEFDKAVYEVMYEARNRPSWLHVPLGSLARLTA